MSPLLSCQGIPISWTRDPGAWPMIRILVVALTERIGLGGKGNELVQTVHA